MGRRNIVRANQGVTLAKTCVFCGAKPKEKTKEHVIPRWLIELTGDPKRKVNLGLVKNFETGFKRREYAFDQFTFPACEGCNNKYASLEAEVKSIIEGILSEQFVSTEEVSLLLDWLDKVRVGLWLGMNQLDKNYAGVDPNFHIETRISQYDRMLIVEKSNGLRQKLNFGGIDTLSFALTPSAFVLIINNYYFTNISYMFLLVRRLGFPYPTRMYINSGEERVEASFSKGRERIMLPVLRKAIKEKGTILYQPMYRGGLIDGDMSEYLSDYVKNHSMDVENGIGNVFLDLRGRLAEYTKGQRFSLTPDHIHDDERLFITSAINICEWQNWLTQFLPSTERLSCKRKQYVQSRFRAGIKINNMLIKHHKSML